jgi:hypothetical protein
MNGSPRTLYEKIMFASSALAIITSFVNLPDQIAIAFAGFYPPPLVEDEKVENEKSLLTSLEHAQRILPQCDLPTDQKP